VLTGTCETLNPTSKRFDCLLQLQNRDEGR
jgi:hypothetical protein